MNDTSAQGGYLLERPGEIAYLEIRQGERIAGTATAVVDTDGRVLAPGLPSLTLSIRAVLKGSAEQTGPEAASAISVIGRKFDETETALHA